MKRVIFRELKKKDDNFAFLNSGRPYILEKKSLETSLVDRELIPKSVIARRLPCFRWRVCQLSTSPNFFNSFQTPGAVPELEPSACA